MTLLQRIRPWLLAAATSMIALHSLADDTRIAVAAEAAQAEAPVSAVAARAPHILIFSADGAMMESYVNPVAANPGGAGPALARWLVEKNVNTLIAGDFGAKLLPSLKERGIRAVQASGSAAQAVRTRPR